MNYIKSELGGFGFVMNDLDYIQESTLEQLNGIISYYSQNQKSFVWSGCEIIQDGSNGNIEMTDGWVVVDGELLKFDSQIIAIEDQEDKVKFEKVITDEVNNPASVKITDSNTTYYAYKKVRAKLTTGLSGNEGIDSSTYSLDDGEQHWYKKSDVANGKEKRLLAENGWNLSSSIKYRKDINGVVHVHGTMFHTSNVTSGNFTTLPVGFRPESKIRGLYITDTTSVPCFVYPNGVIKFLSAAFEDGTILLPPFKGV